MKKLFTGLCMCWGNFCFVPGPKKWDEKARAYMLGWLPTIGFMIGGLWVLIYFAAVWASLPYLAVVAITIWAPFMLSGFIHVDGFMDVSDATMSRAPLEKKRAILKDSRCGTFAIVSFIFLVLMEFGFMASAISYGVDFVNLILIAVIPRAVSGLEVLNSKPMETSQYAEMKATETENEAPESTKAPESIEISDESVIDDKSSNEGEGQFKVLLEAQNGDFLISESEIGDGQISTNFDNEENTDKPVPTKKGNLLIVIQLVLVLGFAALCCTYYLATAFVVVAAALGTLISVTIAKKQLQGMNGDIAGYGILWGELIGIMSLILC